MSDLPTPQTDPKCPNVRSITLKGQQAFAWWKEREAHIFLFAGENKHVFEELCFRVFKRFPIFALKISSP